MSVIFPKPLPLIANTSDPDQTGFTPSEKIALRNSWRVIKRHLRKHAKNIFIDFFAEHEEMLEHFRGPEDKFLMHSLHAHPEAMLHIYDRLIESGLDNHAMFHIILSEVGSRHIKMLKENAQIVVKAKVKACQEYFEGVIKDISSPTAVAALQKLSDIIVSYLV